MKLHELSHTVKDLGRDSFEAYHEGRRQEAYDLIGKLHDLLLVARYSMVPPAEASAESPDPKCRSKTMNSTVQLIMAYGLIDAPWVGDGIENLNLTIATLVKLRNLLNEQPGLEADGAVKSEEPEGG